MSGEIVGEASERPASDQRNFEYLQFFTCFRCHRIPRTLFTRAAQNNIQWDNDGELKPSPGCWSILRQPSLRDGTYLDITTTIREAENVGVVEVEGKPWSPWYTVRSHWNKQTSTQNKSDYNKSNLFIILGIVIHAFPEVWSEICWEEVENQFWEVIQSTCVPFLAVLDGADIKEYLEHYSSDLKRQWLTLLLKLLLRISSLMKSRTPPNFPSLILQGIQILHALGSTGSEDANYFKLRASIIELENVYENQPWVAAEKLNSIGHNESNRSNATIGFALASLPSSWMNSDNEVFRTFMQWNPLSRTAPSTMEILAQEAFAGAASLSRIPGISWPRLPLKMRVIIGLCEAKKDPEKGYEILVDTIQELESAYSIDSIEFLLVVTSITNCYNKAHGMKARKELGSSHALLQNLHGRIQLPPHIEFPEQVYFLMAIADTCLTQGNYVEAETLLLQIIGSWLTDKETMMSAKLRLLKMSRRQRKSSLNFDDWTRLQDLAAGFHQASDIFKYEILEESTIFLSFLNPKEIIGSPLEPCIFEIIKTLSTFPISEYRGSPASRENLAWNIDVLQQLKNEFNLFSVSGPQLYFCRMIRDRFRQVTVQVAERVGAANWRRFQRIKEMWEESEPGEQISVEHEVLDTGKSKFHDSGIGSSIGSEFKLPDQSDSREQQKAKSIISFRSFMQNEFGTAQLPPIPLENSEGNRVCLICRKLLNGINSESQWRHHAFSDLRPYVCLIEGCDAKPTQFSSRSDFAAHLANHQYIKIWKCYTCGYSFANHDLLNEHCLKIHSYSQDGDIQIGEGYILRDLAIQKCPFCDQIPGANAFVGHVCHHLEEISLSSIPKEEEEDIEENEELGPVSRQPSSSASSTSPSTNRSAGNDPKPAVGARGLEDEEGQGIQIEAKDADPDIGGSLSTKEDKKKERSLSEEGTPAKAEKPSVLEPEPEPEPEPVEDEFSFTSVKSKKDKKKRKGTIIEEPQVEEPATVPDLEPVPEPFKDTDNFGWAFTTSKKDKKLKKDAIKEEPKDEEPAVIPDLEPVPEPLEDTDDFGGGSWGTSKKDKKKKKAASIEEPSRD